MDFVDRLSRPAVRTRRSASLLDKGTPRARRFGGFFVGRFDVRYSDEAEFRAGRGFAIVELNGVASESTNLYDPAWPLWRAYRTLFRQWALLFRIRDANRRLTRFRPSDEPDA